MYCVIILQSNNSWIIAVSGRPIGRYDEGVVEDDDDDYSSSDEESDCYSDFSSSDSDEYSTWFESLYLLLYVW